MWKILLGGADTFQSCFLHRTIRDYLHLFAILQITYKVQVLFLYMQENFKNNWFPFLCSKSSKQATLNMFYTKKFWHLWTRVKHLELRQIENFPSDMLFSQAARILTKGNIFYQVFISCGNLTFYW